MTADTVITILRETLKPAIFAQLSLVFIADVNPRLLPGAPAGAPAINAAPGNSASDRGWLMATILPFSGAFMGNGKEAHSNNQKPSHRNNAVLAAAANALTGGVDVAPNFAGWAIKHISPYRALNHAASRQAVAACLRPLLSTAWLKQHNHWEESIYMEVRLELQTMDLDAHDCPLLDSAKTAMESLFRAILKAHQGKTRFNLGLDQILGAANLLRDFIVGYLIPMLLHALAEVPHQVLAETELPEDDGAKALRRTEAWCRLKNGGFQTRNARAYQEAHWYHLLRFVTGRNRVAHSLLRLRPEEFQHPSSVRFIAPYCWEEDVTTDST